MASLTKCRDCGARISTRAKRCPSCGAPAPKKTGCMAWLGLGLVVFFVLGLIGVALKPKEGGAPSAPASADDGRFPVGSSVVVADSNPNHQGVWLAATEADETDLAEAERKLYAREGAHPGEDRMRMAESGRAYFVGNGYSARVTGVSGGLRKVRMTSGEWRSGTDEGWISTRFLRSK